MVDICKLSSTSKPVAKWICNRKEILIDWKSFEVDVEMRTMISVTIKPLIKIMFRLCHQVNVVMTMMKTNEPSYTVEFRHKFRPRADNATRTQGRCRLDDNRRTVLNHLRRAHSNKKYQNLTISTRYALSSCDRGFKCNEDDYNNDVGSNDDDAQVSM